MLTVTGNRAHYRRLSENQAIIHINNVNKRLLWHIESLGAHTIEESLYNHLAHSSLRETLNTNSALSMHLSEISPSIAFERINIEPSDEQSFLANYYDVIR